MQILIDSIISGLTLGLLAMAFNFVYLPTRIFYVALGAVFSAVPFVVWQLLRWNWPVSLAVSVGLGVGLGLSVLSEAVNHAFLERRGASSGAHLIASLGVYLILIQCIVLVWGNDPKVLRVGNDFTLKIGDLVLTRSQLLAALISAIAASIIFIWLRFSKLGLQFRALADNPTELALRGYNLTRLRILAFGISGLICSISSLLVSLDLKFDSFGGLNMILLAVVSIIIGGRNSYVGPLLGAVLLSVIRSEVVWFSSARWETPATFLILALVLFLRPDGILGRKLRLEAQS